MEHNAGVARSVEAEPEQMEGEDEEAAQGSVRRENWSAIQSLNDSSYFMPLMTFIDSPEVELSISDFQLFFSEKLFSTLSQKEKH